MNPDNPTFRSESESNLIRQLQQEVGDLKAKYEKVVKALKRIDRERMSCFLSQKDMLESKLRIAEETLAELGEKE